MIKLVCVGKLKEKALDSLEKEYVKRLSSFFTLRIHEVKDEPERRQSGGDTERIMEVEGERVLSLIKPDDFVVLLDLHGKMIDSLQFARLNHQWLQQAKDVVFVIAGSYGPSPALKSRANYAWKLSDLTFPHTLCRILVLEQIYRGFMIESNRTYHK